MSNCSFTINTLNTMTNDYAVLTFKDNRIVVFGRNFGNGELRAAWRGFHVYWSLEEKS